MKNKISVWKKTSVWNIRQVCGKKREVCEKLRQVSEKIRSMWIKQVCETKKCVKK